MDVSLWKLAQLGNGIILVAISYYDRMATNITIDPNRMLAGRKIAKIALLKVEDLFFLLLHLLFLLQFTARITSSECCEQYEPEYNEDNIVEQLSSY